MEQRALSFFEEMNTRRSIRMFSSEPVPQQLIELAVRTASTAPSGAHKQPWTFVATNDPEIKQAIRAAAEQEEESKIKAVEKQRKAEDGRFWIERWRDRKYI